MIYSVDIYMGLNRFDAGFCQLCKLFPILAGIGSFLIFWFTSFTVIFITGDERTGESVRGNGAVTVRT